MAKDFGMLIDPPDFGKLGVGINPMEQENKYGIGLGNGNYYSTNGSDGYWKRVWNAITQMWEDIWVALGESNPLMPEPGRGVGCGTGADFMLSEEEIIL